MTDPFATALAALFGAPGSVAAMYTPLNGAAPPDPIRVIRDQKSGEIGFGDTNVAAKTSSFSIMCSDIAAPRAGDTLTVGSDVFTIVGSPRLDDEGLSWTVEAPPT